MDFTLNLNIEPADLDVIGGAQQKIALSKPVSNATVSVIWLAFDPFESNTIEWAENYWIYASNVITDRSGATITKLSEVDPGPAMDGSVYTFNNHAVFSEAVKDPDVPKGTFAATNNMGYDKYPALTFGLSQSAQINQKLEDRNPLSASSVLATQNIQITPFTHVYIWLEGHFESSTIITNVTGKRSVAEFGGGTNEIEMTYDGKSGLFHQ